MAKLNKIKFKHTGKHVVNRTTYDEAFSLYLYFNTEQEYFYFDRDELKEYFTEDNMPSQSLFNECYRKQDAVKLMEAYIFSELKETKMLQIELGIPTDLWHNPNPEYKKERHSYMSGDKTIPDDSLPKYLLDILGGGSLYGSIGLTINFKRVMKVEFNGVPAYCECKEDWDYKNGHLHSNGDNLIEWSQGREDFLVNTQVKIHELSKMVMDYLNVGDNIEDFYLKMESNQNLLGTGKIEKK